MTNGAVTFPLMPVPPAFALRVRSGSTALVRTGMVDLSAGTLDEDTGDFAASYFVVQPDPVVIAPAALSGLVPTLPRVTNDDDGNPLFSLNTLALTITGDLINATGTGVYLQTPIGGSVSFTYVFRLLPNGGALSVDRILKVETVSTSVVSADGSLLGFLINLVGDFLLWLMQQEVVSQIEKTIQAEIDLAVQTTLAAAGVGAGVTVTAISVITDTTAGITVRPLATLSTVGMCPTGITFGSIRLRPVAQIRALAAMRDQVLRGSPRGELYVRMFHKYEAELLQLLIRHPALLKQADATVATGLKDYRPEAPARGVMSKATAGEATRLLEMVAKLGSPELAALARA